MELSLIAPELREPAARMPRLALDRPVVRWFINQAMRLMPTPAVGGVVQETVLTTSGPMRLYRPETPQSDAALLWIHGGGHLIGTPAQDHAFCAEICRTLGITVLAARYRLSPGHPFPAAQEDCLSAWRWLQQNGAGLGVDVNHIVIGGQSAGGGLAAGLVQSLRDAGGTQPLGQWLFCPMLDDRTAALRDLDALDHRVWTNRLNRAGWRAYLGQEPGAATLPRYAAPAREADLKGLPPSWIGVGDIDLFFAEDRAYAERLKEAGVATQFVTVPGAPHGFESWAAETGLARSFLADARDWLRQLIDGTISSTPSTRG